MSDHQILLVDDDPDLRRLLAIRLKAAGYGVTDVESAEKALAVLAAARPQLVITDLRMPGMDGMALFEHVQKTNPSLPVIVLTAHGSIPDAVDATQRGVFGYLTKPYQAKALLEQVEKALSAGGATSAPSRRDATWRTGIITRSAAMEDLLAQAEMVAATDASVLVQGESGTGKELLARAIHRASPRARHEFMAINCGAIPEALLESELFGYVRGAFTGAARDHKGLFQAAAGGTLFLDEIGDMPLALQVKLLRVLEEREVRPLGSVQSVPVDVRIISATHRDLMAAKDSGTFREDLYYRLNVVALALPTLEQRREDISLLAEHFMRQLAEKYRKSISAFAPEALERLTAARWPGNVRQLYNVVEQAVALCPTAIIPPALVEKALVRSESPIVPFEDARRQFERDYLVQLLKMTEGNVSQAAKLAKRNRTEFYRLLQRHELDPGLFKPKV